MGKRTRTAGFIFLAVASVYSGWAAFATSANVDAPVVNTNLGTAAEKLRTPANDVDPLTAAAEAVDHPTPATAPSSASASMSMSAVATTQPAGASSPTPPTQTPTAPAEAPQVKMSDAGTFSIQISTDVNLLDVLRMIGSQAQISIIPSKDVRGTIPAMDLYNVTVPEALDAILQSNGFVYKTKGNFIYVYSAKELADLEKQDRQLATEVFRVYYTPAANAVNMIKPVLSAEAQVSFSTPAISGIDTGTKDSGGDSHSTQDCIVITDYSENLDKVRRILKEVDRRPQQILVEATILRASLSEDNALGIDFTILGSVDFSQLAGVTHTAADALTGSILNDPNSSNIISKGYNGASTGFTQSVPQGGLQIGVVQNNVALFLRALESVTDTTILANPKVLALDKQRGEVIVGRKDGYITTTVTENAQTQTVEFLDTGTRLVFRPYVGDDGYIRMEVHPEDSSGGLTGANLPFKITTEVTSNIMVKDGHTVLIGGLFRESSNTTRAQVPFLGNLPLAGPLFRQQRDQTTREEIIILLTPHIIKDDQAFSDASEAERAEMEKLRVGVRQGMMPSGRERLAESCYADAVDEMHKANPDLNTVRWHLDCATNLNPKFREAIDLKEKITGQQLSENDNSSIRTFISRQILADRRHAMTRPSYGADELTPPREVVIPGATTMPASMMSHDRGGGAATINMPISIPAIMDPATAPLVPQKFLPGTSLPLPANRADDGN